MGTPSITRCRICESACGLLADLTDGEVTALRPDPDHPLSQGYACRKGPAFVQVQSSPARVLRPLCRTSDGLAQRSWAEALAGAGGALAALRREHGPESVGLFVGNAAGHSLGAVLGATALQRGLGTSKNYTALTLDNSEMFVVLEEVLGEATGSFVADYDGADLLVLLGTDPLSSQPSQAQSRPGVLPRLLALAREDGLVVLDPRASATAQRASLHLRPRPGADVFVLAWLLREALGSERHAARRAEDPLLDPADLAELGRAVQGFTRARASEEAGLTEEELGGLRDRLLAAERPLVWSGLGVLLGPDGTLGYWLTLALQAALCGIDAEGGWVQQRGAVDLPSLLGRLGVKGSDPELRSRIGGFPAVLGTLASATLADDILTEGPGQLRGLVVLGGNPLLSLPDAGKARAALSSLSLLVSIDLFLNDTGTLSDFVLPAATWLERDEIDLHAGNQRERAHLQIDRAVCQPRGEARPDWEILLALTRAAGCRPFGSALADLALRTTGVGPLGIARLAMLGSGVSWRRVSESPYGLTLDRSALGALRVRGSAHPDRRLRLAVPRFVSALRDPLGPPARPNPGALQLLSSVRPVETMNSWMHATRGAERRVPVARMHPLDHARLGAPDQIALRPAGPGPSLLTVSVSPDPGVRQGVLVLPYGWGHEPGAVGAGGGPVGVNVNALVTTTRLERFTGQPLSNGLWVDVVAPPAQETAPPEN